MYPYINKVIIVEQLEYLLQREVCNADDYYISQELLGVLIISEV